MKIFYYNESLKAQDGASCHAFGLLNALRNHHSVEQIKTYPILKKDQCQPPIKNGSRQTSHGFSFAEQVLRIIKRYLLSNTRSRFLSNYIKTYKIYSDTVMIARVNLFDTTPLKVANRLKLPLVAEWNTPFYYEFGSLRKGALIGLCKKWESRFLQNSNLIYTVSNQLKRMIVDEFKISKSKAIVIPNGYDPLIFPNSSHEFICWRNRVRKKMDWKGKMVIVFIGSLKIWHGLINLIKIAQYFNDENKKILFVVIGDGEMRDHIENASKSLWNLKWIGSIPPSITAQYLTGCDLGLMPYLPIKDFYYSPLKLYDMIGAALPSVGFMAGQIAEIYSDFPEAGWGISSSDSIEYIEAIKKIEKNRNAILEKREKLIITRKEHSWENRVDKLVKNFFKIGLNKLLS